MEDGTQRTIEDDWTDHSDSHLVAEQQWTGTTTFELLHPASSSSGQGACALVIQEREIAPPVDKATTILRYSTEGYRDHWAETNEHWIWWRFRPRKGLVNPVFDQPDGPTRSDFDGSRTSMATFADGNTITIHDAWDEKVRATNVAKA